jgi:hypothetical protein
LTSTVTLTGESGEEIHTDTDGLLEDLRYLRRSAAQTLSDMRNNTDSIDVGGVAIAGISAKRLGLYAGQRYAVHRLFYRPRGPYAADERRLDVQVRVAHAARRLRSPCVLRLSLARGRRGGWHGRERHRYRWLACMRRDDWSSLREFS